MSSPSANSSSGPSWFDIDDPKLLEKTWLRPSLSEITHLDWSPCSKYVLIGAVEGKVINSILIFFLTFSLLIFFLI